MALFALSDIVFRLMAAALSIIINQTLSGSPMIVKILRAAEWDRFNREQCFDGAPVDVADGYIHFSTPAQAIETAAKHFGGADGLQIVAVDPARLGAALRWEPSRGGQLFPHLYGVLEMNHVLWHETLPLGPDGRHVFPERMK